jgi:Ni/Co efflux regulator RcnB
MLKSTLLVATMLATLGAMPALAASATAQDRNDRARRQAEHRVYDRAHRDYHTWNGDEDRRYREFLTERRRTYREFSRVNRNRQTEYWQWRHAHDHR